MLLNTSDFLAGVPKAMLQALPAMAKPRAVIGATLAKATVKLVVVGVGALTMQDIVIGESFQK